MTVKLGVYLLVAAAAAWAAKSYYDWAYDHGQRDAALEYQEAARQSIRRALDQAEERRLADIEVIEAGVQREVQTVIKYRYLKEEAVHAKVADCRDLGPEPVRVLNRAIEAARDAGGPSPAVAD